MSNITEATEKDWEDFWKSEDVINSYSEYLEEAGQLARQLGGRRACARGTKGSAAARATAPPRSE